MIRTIRSMLVVTLALLFAAGVAALLLTVHAHNKAYSDTTLFALAWSSSAVGIVGAAATIVGCMSKDSFGTKAFTRELFEIAGGVFLLTWLFAIFVAGVVLGNYETINAGFCLCTIGAASVGFILGFIAQYATQQRESWTSSNEQIAELYDIRNERAS